VYDRSEPAPDRPDPQGPSRSAAYPPERTLVERRTARLEETAATWTTTATTNTTMPRMREGHAEHERRRQHETGH
jgi:hypothetical protein